MAYLVMALDQCVPEFRVTRLRPIVSACPAPPRPAPLYLLHRPRPIHWGNWLFSTHRSIYTIPCVQEYVQNRQYTLLEVGEQKSLLEVRTAVWICADVCTDVCMMCRQTCV